MPEKCEVLEVRVFAKENEDEHQLASYLEFVADLLRKGKTKGDDPNWELYSHDLTNF